MNVNSILSKCYNKDKTMKIIPQLTSMFYISGTYAGCTGVWLVAGFPGQVACNVATAPGSIGCGMNTLNCYMRGCGLIRIPDSLRRP